MAPTDADLMDRWRRGDPLAFEALVRRWQEPVGRILNRLAGPDRAADLSQEVFLRVYHARPRYSENGAFSAWIYRIALNVAHDAARRRRREPARLAGPEPADPRASVQEICQRQELDALVARAVAELPEPLRVVLVLHHYEKMNFEAIARLTGIPASTLKSRFSAALGRLKERLQHLGLQ